MTRELQKKSTGARCLHCLPLLSISPFFFFCSTCRNQALNIDGCITASIHVDSLRISHGIILQTVQPESRSKLD
ncbi:unnamed protein product [Coffea canephora]|uniref:Uncharacterized protein n=1 Tax=Coffea canephora TaxID=49390 RepID=A0A068TT08_COFCA|nr:unnamed protein product [Coffea canephora]